jgi:hypothetical protein
MKTRTSIAIVAIVLGSLAVTSANAQLPDPGLTIDTARTAVVITDPQNDFLSPDGVTWGLVGASVTANKTVENIESLIKAAKSVGMPVFISPHYYYPTDDGWQFGGAVETMMHSVNMFGRTGALSTEGFSGSGADWLERYKPLIEDGITVVVSPHKVYGPDTNDLVLQSRMPLQPRRRRISMATLPLSRTSDSWPTPTGRQPRPQARSRLGPAPRPVPSNSRPNRNVIRAGSIVTPPFVS